MEGGARTKSTTPLTVEYCNINLIFLVVVVRTHDCTHGHTVVGNNKVSCMPIHIKPRVLDFP
jgi:hypothetical protein